MYKFIFVILQSVVKPITHFCSVSNFLDEMTAELEIMNLLLAAILITCQGRYEV